MVCPVLDYGSSIWNPQGVVLQELESMQKLSARFVTGNYNYETGRMTNYNYETGSMTNYNYETGSMTDILGQLKWESLKKRRKDNILILLYKWLKGIASLPTEDLIPEW